MVILLVAVRINKYVYGQGAIKSRPAIAVERFQERNGKEARLVERTCTDLDRV